MFKQVLSSTKREGRMTKSRGRLPTKKAIRALLIRHACPLGYHQVRTRILGGIVCLYPMVNPINVIASLWGGTLPQFDSRHDMDELIGALVVGLWNELSDFQNPKTRFKAERMPVKPTLANLCNFSMIRAQEIEGFVEGLLNEDNEVSLPELAHKAITQLVEIRSMLLAIVDLVKRTNGNQVEKPEIKQLMTHLQVMTVVMEAEIHTAVLACVRARAQNFYTPQSYLSNLLH